MTSSRPSRSHDLVLQYADLGWRLFPAHSIIASGRAALQAHFKEFFDEHPEAIGSAVRPPLACSCWQGPPGGDWGNSAAPLTTISGYTRFPNPAG